MVYVPLKVTLSSRIIAQVFSKAVNKKMQVASSLLALFRRKTAKNPPLKQWNLWLCHIIYLAG